MSNTILGTIRASSWPSLFDCSYRWYWQNIAGLRSPASGRSVLGTAIHAGTAVYDLAVLAGQVPSVDAAVDASHAAVMEPGEDVRWDPQDLARGKAASFAVRLTAKYCQDIAPQQVYRAVEVKCHALDVATDHGVVRLTGSTDRVRMLADGRMGIADLKTGHGATSRGDDGNRQAKTKGHHLQLGVYTLMAEAETRLVLDAPAQIIGLSTDAAASCATGEVADVKTPLLGDGERPGLIARAAEMLKTGDFQPNPSSVLCSNRYCPAWDRHCKFHN